MGEIIGRIQGGNLAMVACCIFYLIWWSIAFNPNRKFAMTPKVVLFLCTFAAGLAGVLLMVDGINRLQPERGSITNVGIVAAGFIAYFVLLALTYLIMHRQVTTELALIVGWTVLEACVVNSLYRAGLMGVTPAIAAVVVIVVAAVIGMACYLAYYNLEAQVAFYDGMVPLILFAVVEAFMIVLVWWCTHGLA